MADTLADLMREVGIEPSALVASAAQPRPPLLPRRGPPRPMPRQMRAPEFRAADPRLAPSERQRAYSQVQRTQTPPPGEAYAPPRNQFAEAGQMAFEATGVPAANRSGQALHDQRYNDAAWEGGSALLALGTLGLPGARGPRPPVRAPVTARTSIPRPPPRLPARASDGSVLPVRPTEPFRNSLRGGSEDLTEAAGMRLPDAGQANGGATTLGPVARRTFTGPRGQEYEVVIAPDPNAGVAAVSFARVRTDGFAARHRPHNDLTPGEARSVYREVARIVREDAAQHGRAAYGGQGYTDRQTGLYAALSDDALPGYVREPNDRAIIMRRAPASPGGGNASAGQTPPPRAGEAAGEALSAPSVGQSSEGARPRLPDGSTAKPPDGKAQRRPTRPPPKGGFSFGAPR